MNKMILFDSLIWKIAWRDAIRSRAKLFLFAISLTLGVAAVTTISSLNYIYQDTLNQHAKQLMGADLIIRGNHPFEQEIVTLFDSLDLEQAKGLEMNSMVSLTKNGNSSLVHIIGFEGDYPFYGQVDTYPHKGAYEKINTGRYTLLDETLFARYDAHLGDSLKIGSLYVSIVGVSRKKIGPRSTISAYLPSLYLSHRVIYATGLIRYGSKILYSRFFKTKNKLETARIINLIEPMLLQYGHTYSTVERYKKSLGKTIQPMYRFFTLLAFMALLLGCIGIASSAQIYAKEKYADAATLKCLGLSGWKTVGIYFLQMVIVGLLSSLVGIILGIEFQQIIPFILKEYFPIDIAFAIPWKAVVEGLFLGVGASMLFAALPLISLRAASPLVVLRGEYNVRKKHSKEQWFILLLLILFPFFVGWYQTDDISYAFYLTGGVTMVLTTILGVSYLFLYVAKRYVLSAWSFEMKYALYGLFRPNNQTVVLMMSIGFGVFIMATLYIIQHNLLRQTESINQENQSNVILFDIQSNQKTDVAAEVEKAKFDIHRQVPIVVCRLRMLNGKHIEAIRNDDTNSIPDWALTREYRVTYSDSLQMSEEIIEGTIHTLKKKKKDSVAISVSKDMMEMLHLKVGDALTFDVQGVSFSVRISGVRDVDWPKNPPNFIFTFPLGVLEKAPQIWAFTTRADSTHTLNHLQRTITARFPNVSVFDFRFVLETVNDFLTKIGQAVRFLAFFSMVTGLVVLASAVLNNRYVRMREKVLFSMLGARSRQVTVMVLFEYFFLAIFSSLAGMLLAFISGWALSHFFLQIKVVYPFYEMIIIMLSTIALVVWIGWVNSRKLRHSSPLKIMREL